MKCHERKVAKVGSKTWLAGFLRPLCQPQYRQQPQPPVVQQHLGSIPRQPPPEKKWGRRSSAEVTHSTTISSSSTETSTSTSTLTKSTRALEMHWWNFVGKPKQVALISCDFQQKWRSVCMCHNLKRCKTCDVKMQWAVGLLVAGTTTSTTSTSTTTRSTSSTSSSSTSTSGTSSSTTSISSSSTTRTSSSTSSTTSSTSSSSSTSTSITTSSTTSSTTSTSSTSTSTASSTSTTITQTSRTSTVTTTATTSTSSSTSSSVTKTSSSTSTNTVTRTSITTTEGVPQEISPAELEAMEAQRKEEAKQAVAAVEAAETAAVLEAFSQIFSSGNRSDTPPGVLGEARIKTDAGPVKVAALSVEAVAAAGEAVKISAGEDSSAEVEVDAGAATGTVGLHNIRGQWPQCGRDLSGSCSLFRL